jgi:hypothetical protein
MFRCRVDKSIERVIVNGFAFPLGAYPVEEMSPRPGYTVAFEQADGGNVAGEGAGFEAGGEFDPEAEEGDEDGALGSPEGAEGEWEEWPDRYVYDVLVSATRVETLCRSLFALLPGRVYPILDFLGTDEYREVDPYVSYDLLGLDRLLDTVRRYRGFFFEDGLVGFGAMSEEPFMYVFVDEHKIVTVRVESALKDKVEAILRAFDLEEVDEIRGADAATHEHRGVLEAPPERLDLLTAEEIVEELRDDWRLVLNVDPTVNIDEDGNPLGITGWRCIVRHEPMPPENAPANAEPPPFRYVEVLLAADCLNAAEDLALDALDQLLGKSGGTPASDPKEVGRGIQQHLEGEVPAEGEDGGELPPVEELTPATVVVADRLRPESLVNALERVGKPSSSLAAMQVLNAVWISS